MAKLPAWLRYGGTFTLGGVIVWIATHWVHPHRWPDANEWEALGTSATVGVAIFGFWNWGHVHQKERDARISAAVMLVTIELCSTLRRILEEARYAGEVLSENAPTVYYEQIEAWKAAIAESRLAQRLAASLVEVQAFLPDLADLLVKLQGALDRTWNDLRFAERIALSGKYKEENLFLFLNNGLADRPAADKRLRWITNTEQIILGEFGKHALATRRRRRHRDPGRFENSPDSDVAPN